MWLNSSALFYHFNELNIENTNEMDTALVKRHQIKKRWADILIRKHYFKSIFLVYISHLTQFRCWMPLGQMRREDAWWIQSKAQVIKHNQVEMSSDLHANDSIFLVTNRPCFSLLCMFRVALPFANSLILHHFLSFSHRMFHFAIYMLLKCYKMRVEHRKHWIIVSRAYATNIFIVLFMYWMPFFSDKFDFKDATAQC